MSTLTIELPAHRTQTEFNLRRWTEVRGDPEMWKIEGRVETDRHGHVLMSPPPGSTHGRYQARIAILLDRFRGDHVLTECPISTADGVRAADVAWASAEVLRHVGENDVLSRAPEICVEVLSPDNTAAEMRDKTALYFDAGAREVWHCSKAGKMTFFAADRATPLTKSKLCPDFPTQIHLR